MHFTSKLGFLGSLLLPLPTAFAGFSSSSTTNLAVYWGEYLEKEMFTVSTSNMLQVRILMGKGLVLWRNNDYLIIVRVSDLPVPTYIILT